MAIYGYVRKEVNASLMEQLEVVQRYPVKEIFVEEEAFATDTELQRLIAKLEPREDTIVVQSLIVFGKGLRQIKNLLEELRLLETRLVSEAEGIDTAADGETFYRTADVLLEVERIYHGLHTKKGLVKAKRKGLRGGRPSISKEVLDQIYYYYFEKQYSVRTVSEKCGVSIGTVHKYVKEQRLLNLEEQGTTESEVSF